MNLKFFLRFIPCPEKRLALLNDPSPHFASNHSRWQPCGSTNHVFGPVKLHDYLFELPRMAREAGRPIKDSASSRNHWDVRTAPHANRAP